MTEPWTVSRKDLFKKRGIDGRGGDVKGTLILEKKKKKTF